MIFGLLLGLTPAIVILGVLSFGRKVQTFQPVGLEVENAGPSLVISSVQGPSELVAGDRLVLVNGEQVVDTGELRKQLRRRSVSEVVVLRGEAMVTVNHPLPELSLDLSYILLALIGVVYLLVGLYTLLRGAASRPNEGASARGAGLGPLFYLWCIASMAVYLLTPIVPAADGLDRAIYLVDEAGRLLLPALMLHFFLVFPAPAFGPADGRLTRRVAAFLYVPAVALFATQLDLIYLDGETFAGAPTEHKLIALDRLELYMLVAFAFLSAALLVRHFLRTQRWEEGRQVLWIALGMVAGYAPFFTLYLLPTTFGFSTPEALQVVAVLPLCLVPMSFAYAILRYRLWDIAIIVRDVVTYTLTLLLGALGFSLISLLIRRSIPEDFQLTRDLSTLAGGLLIAGILIPAKQSIGATLQRFHYRGSFGRRRALSHFGQELLHERDLDDLSHGLLQELEECMELEGINLYLLEDELLKPIRTESPTLDMAEDLSLADLDPEWWDQDYVVLAGPGLPESRLRADHLLHLQGYRCAFPLLVRDRRVGLVVAGNKQGQVPLNSDDAMLIRQLLNQAALAIENAQLLEQMQKQLREVLELKQFNEEIIESSPAGIAVIDDNHRIVLANLAFAALVGADRGGLKRQRIEDVLSVDVPPADGRVIEVDFVDHRGREHQLQLSDASLLGDRAPGLRVLVVHDVTEHVAMEKALEEKERLAALGVMAAGVAHEVNTPLTGISSYAQMLLAKTPEDDPRHELLRKVESQTFRAARIVNSLLEFARASRPDPEPVDLLPVLEESCDLLKARFRDHQIELQWPEHIPAHMLVEGNEGELHQVFANLLTNALEATEGNDSPTISFELETNDSQVAVHVVDNGAGVSPENLGQIFQPFFSTKLDAGGTGLGLSISYEIVRRHGGELRARNEAGGGCRFSVILPSGTGEPKAGGIDQERRGSR